MKQMMTIYDAKNIEELLEYLESINDLIGSFKRNVNDRILEELRIMENNGYRIGHIYILQFQIMIKAKMKS
jgi:hypothetical protein